MNVSKLIAINKLIDLYRKFIMVEELMEGAEMEVVANMNGKVVVFTNSKQVQEVIDQLIAEEFGTNNIDEVMDKMKKMMIHEMMNMFREVSEDDNEDKKKVRH